MDNFTYGSIFFLMGFSDVREIQVVHAVLFLIIYLVALLGNLLIITLTTKDHQLHTPTYFFLKNFSFLDLCLISITVPKSIMNSLMNHNTISLLGCVSQVFFFFLLVSTEVALLTVMSYDRYVAVCHPLRYDIIMGHRACMQMVTISWVSGGLNVILHTASTFSIPMCGLPEIHQFFCDVPQLLSLACSYNIGEFVVIGLHLVLYFWCFVFIDISYIYIFSTVLRMPSKERMHKAISTCLPHLLVVTLFLSSGFFAYLHPLPKYPSLLDLLVSVLYTVMLPTMNPLIYSLRNNDMKMALRKLIRDTYNLSI
ncbi:LOW QUALITY PROTEIN: olfactory receptor 14A16-like [Mustela lutreola]|uniref:LOW QUALITY PROTEIN: olfactory receptor 14A16-like n=1 Tax=Mustela lutreola TaxID=9666 RepID=UPI0027975480|nr:LOW QUALITY PROTEIN: olfactory receptor 14A16-like [Mustela lutreola]